MLPSHFQASKETITRLMSIAAGLGLKGYELGDKVNEFKQNEAKMINQQGLKAQIDYIFESFGPEGIEKASEEIRNVLLDYAKAGQIIRCTTCKRDEFRSEATKHGEGWLCPRCLKGLQDSHGIK